MLAHLQGLVRRPSPPPPPLQHGATAIRSVSSHYVEQLLEKAVEEQQLMTRSVASEHLRWGPLPVTTASTHP
jgi:hypothetical protein